MKPSILRDEDNLLVITGAILAGGLNSRFGQNKALINIDGKTLIERIIEVFSTIFDEILIISSSPDIYNKFDSCRVIGDILPIGGPLIGIYSALIGSKYDAVFVSACDMPFINPSLINYMIDKMINFDIVVPEIDNNKLEPLHAIYSKACIPFIKKKIDENKTRIISFFNDVLVYKVNIEEIKKLDSNLNSFFNINTMEDYKKAVKYVKKNFKKPLL